MAREWSTIPRQARSRREQKKVVPWVARQSAHNPTSQASSLIRLLFGIVTIYAGQYVGEPLYCDDGSGLVYNERTTPWVALSIKEYTSGRVQCGDEILIWGDDWSIVVRALDAGPLHRYYIEDWPDLPIIGDLPQFIAPFPGLSAKAQMVNVTATKRLLEGMTDG